MHCARCLRAAVSRFSMIHQQNSTAQFNDAHLLLPLYSTGIRLLVIVVHHDETNEDTEKNQLQHDDLAGVKLRSRPNR